MIAVSRRQNARGLARTSNISSNDRPRSSGEAEKDMWSSMLDNVASGKKLPEKNILVLGGNPESQKEFLDTLGPESSKRPQERHRRKPPVANEFALGYTYQDVLDTDHEDILARLSIYLLSEPTLTFSPLIKPLLNSRSVPHTLVVLLLDWAEPWLWVRQLRDWVRFLKEITSSLDEETRDTMSQHMKDWQQRIKGGGYEASGVGSEGGISIPLGQGEWDEALGLPLCVVCHSADKIEGLEKELGWREEKFDFVLQFLRTILLKHGASLLYASMSVPNSLPTLVHSMLGIHSLLKKQTLKHNVIDRDRVLIPPNWDSWGKIRVLREGFDVEGISRGWSIDVQQSFNSSASIDNAVTEKETKLHDRTSNSKSGQVLPAYEDVIKDPNRGGETDSAGPNHGIEIEVVNTQEFLASQLEIMERLKAEEEKSQQAKDSRTPSDRPILGKDIDPASDFPTRVGEHIGPVQFNFGGIQVDSDGISTKPKAQAVPSVYEKETSPPGTPEVKGQTETLQTFFASLMTRGPTNSPKSSSSS